MQKNPKISHSGAEPVTDENENPMRLKLLRDKIEVFRDVLNGAEGEKELELLGKLFVGLLSKECERKNTQLDQVKKIIDTRNDEIKISQLFHVIEYLGVDGRDSEIECEK